VHYIAIDRLGWIPEIQRNLIPNRKLEKVEKRGREG
jgi:hypothetical protein